MEGKNAKNVDFGRVPVNVVDGYEWSQTYIQSKININIDGEYAEKTKPTFDFHPSSALLNTKVQTDEQILSDKLIQLMMLENISKLYKDQRNVDTKLNEINDANFARQQQLIHMNEKIESRDKSIKTETFCNSSVIVNVVSVICVLSILSMGCFITYEHSNTVRSFVMETNERSINTQKQMNELIESQRVHDIEQHNVIYSLKSDMESQNKKIDGLNEQINEHKENIAALQIIHKNDVKLIAELTEKMKVLNDWNNYTLIICTTAFTIIFIVIVMIIIDVRNTRNAIKCNHKQHLVYSDHIAIDDILNQNGYTKPNYAINNNGQKMLYLKWMIHLLLIIACFVSMGHETGYYDIEINDHQQYTNNQQDDTTYLVLPEVASTNDNDVVLKKESSERNENVPIVSVSYEREHESTIEPRDEANVLIDIYSNNVFITMVIITLWLLVNFTIVIIIVIYVIKTYRTRCLQSLQKSQNNDDNVQKCPSNDDNESSNKHNGADDNKSYGNKNNDSNDTKNNENNDDHHNNSNQSNGNGAGDGGDGDKNRKNDDDKSDDIKTKTKQKKRKKKDKTNNNKSSDTVQDDNVTSIVDTSVSDINQSKLNPNATPYNPSKYNHRCSHPPNLPTIDEKTVFVTDQSSFMNFPSFFNPFTTKQTVNDELSTKYNKAQKTTKKDDSSTKKMLTKNLGLINLLLVEKHGISDEKVDHQNQVASLMDNAAELSAKTCKLLTKKKRKKSKKKNKKKWKNKRRSRQNVPKYEPTESLRGQGHIEVTKVMKQTIIPNRIKENYSNLNHFFDRYTALNDGTTEFNTNNGKIKILNCDFHDKNTNEMLYCKCVQSTNKGYAWKLDGLMNDKQILDEYGIVASHLPKSPKANYKFTSKSVHENKIKETIRDSTKIYEIIENAQWQNDENIPVFGVKNGKRSMILSFEKTAFTEQCKESIKKKDRNDITLIPILIFTGTDYEMQHVWIIDIDGGNVNIGISFKYDEKNSSVKITGIHCDKNCLLEQHQLVSSDINEKISNCLDNFSSNITYLNVCGNPDIFYKHKYKKLKEFVKESVNVNPTQFNFESFCRDGREIISK